MARQAGCNDGHILFTGTGHFLSCRSIRRLPEKYCKSATLCAKLRGHPYSQAAFLAGQMGQCRPQKTPERQMEPPQPPEPVAPAPVAAPRPMPYPGYVLPDSAPLSDLIPPAAIRSDAVPEPPTPQEPSAAVPVSPMPQPPLVAPSESSALPPTNIPSAVPMTPGSGAPTSATASSSSAMPVPVPEVHMSEARGAGACDVETAACSSCSYPCECLRHWDKVAQRAAHKVPFGTFERA